MGEAKVKRIKRHALPAAALANVTPEDVWMYLDSTGWSNVAAHWLAHETPLQEALVYIAISHRVAPIEVLGGLVAWSLEQKARREAAEPSPQPPNTKRSRRL